MTKKIAIAAIVVVIVYMFFAPVRLGTARRPYPTKTEAIRAYEMLGGWEAIWYVNELGQTDVLEPRG